jgi:hypothetical protein
VLRVKVVVVATPAMRIVIRPRSDVDARRMDPRDVSHMMTFYYSEPPRSLDAMTKTRSRQQPAAPERPRTTIPNIVQLIPGTTRLPIGPQPVSRAPADS